MNKEQKVDSQKKPPLSKMAVSGSFFSYEMEYLLFLLEDDIEKNFKTFSKDKKIKVTDLQRKIAHLVRL